MTDTIVEKIIELMNQKDRCMVNLRKSTENKDTAGHYILKAMNKCQQQLEELEKTHPEEYLKANEIVHPLTQKQKEIQEKFIPIINAAKSEAEAEELFNKYLQEMEEARSNN